MWPKTVSHFSSLSFEHNMQMRFEEKVINPLNAELNPIRHLLALEGARHIVHVSRIRVSTARKMVFIIKVTL